MDRYALGSKLLTIDGGFGHIWDIAATRIAYGGNLVDVNT
jgi:hypothetical protein